MQTIRYLFQMRPGLLVILAGVVRVADTFQAVHDECSMLPYIDLRI